MTINHNRRSHVGWRSWPAFGGMAIGLFLAALPALAIHDLKFQLDRDVLNSTTTSVGGDEQLIDWDLIFTPAGTNQNSLPAGFDAAGFKKDFSNSGNTFLTSDSSTYATGSKDTLSIALWQCNFDNNVNSKIDIMNAYATSYTDPSSGDEILYFALERNTNTGTANVGFWFLQDEVNCSSNGGAADFEGRHRDGDILIVSEFTVGGTVSTIQVYRWDGDDATGSLNPTPLFAGADCATTGVNDPACAVANSANITTPWLTANFKDKVGNTLRAAEFFEGGINLTALNLGGKCFNSFIGETRSSVSLTATIFDFAAGTLGQCDSSIVTTPSVTTAAIPADPNDASVSVTDSATVTVDGVSDWSGLVSFYLCGPTDPSSTALCESGGVAIGTSKTASDETPTVVSDAAIVTAAGRYCFRSEFTGDPDVGIPPSEEHAATECFIVTPRQPTLVTQATIGPVPFGQSISDVAYLANTAHKPGSGGPAGSDGSINPTTLGGDATGTIFLTAYGPNSCSTVAYGPVQINVIGDGAYGGPGTNFEFTPSAPGEYVFVASYSGDSPNTLGVAAIACNLQPAEERVVVQQIPTTIATTQRVYPNDSATIASSVGGDNLPAGGTVIFRLYDNDTCSDTDDVVGATGLLYKETKSVTGGANSETVSTNNTTVSISTSQTVYWKVTYATGDLAHTGSQSDCLESTAVTFVNDAGPGALFP